MDNYPAGIARPEVTNPRLAAASPPPAGPVVRATLSRSPSRSLLETENRPGGPGNRPSNGKPQIQPVPRLGHGPTKPARPGPRNQPNPAQRVPPSRAYGQLPGFDRNKPNTKRPAHTQPTQPGIQPARPQTRPASPTPRPAAPAQRPAKPRPAAPATRPPHPVRSALPPPAAHPQSPTSRPGRK